MFPRNQHVPFHEVRVLALLQLSLVPGVICSLTEDHPQNEEIQINITISIGHLGTWDTDMQLCTWSMAETQGKPTQVVVGSEGIYPEACPSANSSQVIFPVHIPPLGYANKHLCISTSRVEGVHLIRKKSRPKCYSLDQKTSSGAINTYKCTYMFINLKKKKN